MKKIITKSAFAALALALLLAGGAKAQTANNRIIRLSLGLNGGIPTVQPFNYVIGADIRIQKDFSRNISGLFSFGYTEFQQGKGSAFADFGYVPVKAGGKYFPLQNLYVSGEIGAALNQYRASSSEFIWAPGAGYTFNNGVDLGLRYEESRRHGVATGQVALRVGYAFDLTGLTKTR